MLIEMHCHTSKHSPCSFVDPVTLVRSLAGKGLDGVVLTEHHYLWREEEIAALREESALPDSFLILAGQEVGTDRGHVLVYGAGRTIDEMMTLEDLRKCFPDAALILAHPYRWGRIPETDELLSPLLDAVEVLNCNQTDEENRRGADAWQSLSFTAVSGSDTHAETEVGIYPARFEATIETIDDLVQAIKEGRCRPFNREES